VTQSQIAPEISRLVQDAQAGSSGALDELVAEHLPLVYNIIGRALAGHPDVDDVVQETMLRAIRGLPSLREPTRFRSWLIAIAYRQIQLYLRSRKATRQRRVSEPVELPDPSGDFAESTAAELVVADQRRELVEAARWLDDSDRRLLGLWWQEASGELTRTELAAALDVQPKHAAVRVQRMKAQLEAARGIVRALRARPRCPELSDQLRRWNGVADPLWRKRLVRHVRECVHCAPRREGLVAPEQLLLGMAALPVPLGLMTGVKFSVPAKIGLIGLVQHKTLTVAAATTVAVSGGVAYAVYQESVPPGSDSVIAAPTPARAPSPGTARRVQGSTPSPSASATSIRPPVVGTGAADADLFVAPGGSDTGKGTAAKPFATLGKAVSAVKPGQTIALRGGTYKLTKAVNIKISGTAAKRITLSNFKGERPVIDASALPATDWAIVQESSFWTVQGLEVTGSKAHPYVCRGCHDNVFRRLSMHDNARSGLLLRDPGTTNNQVLDSDFYRNHDPAGAAGIGVGLGIMFGDGTGNLIRGNRAYDNGGPGFELGEFADAVTVEYNWAWGNNSNGFTLAGGSPPVSAAHKLRHNAAWDNASNGFGDDGVGGAMQLSNNTAFRNGGNGFSLPNAAAVLRANASVDNKGGVAALAANAQLSRNSWQLTGWNASMFRSTDPAIAEGPRQADGSLPATAFLAGGNGVGASMGSGS
jgi:RNA polymerase sigma factor (sigma-70 family)